MSMMTGILPSYTLSDEYFEQRASYSATEIEAIQDAALPVAFAHALEHSPFSIGCPSLLQRRFDLLLRALILPRG